jgi:hypothetical protein
LPDHAGLGVQTANLIFKLAEEGWDAERRSHRAADLGANPSWICPGTSRGISRCRVGRPGAHRSHCALSPPYTPARDGVFALCGRRTRTAAPSHPKISASARCSGWAPCRFARRAPKVPAGRLRTYLAFWTSSGQRSV